MRTQPKRRSFETTKDKSNIELRENRGKKRKLETQPSIQCRRKRRKEESFQIVELILKEIMDGAVLRLECGKTWQDYDQERNQMKKWLGNDVESLDIPKTDQNKLKTHNLKRKYLKRGKREENLKNENKKITNFFSKVEHKKVGVGVEPNPGLENLTDNGGGGGRGGEVISVPQKGVGDNNSGGREGLTRLMRGWGTSRQRKVTCLDIDLAQFMDYGEANKTGAAEKHPCSPVLVTKH